MKNRNFPAFLIFFILISCQGPQVLRNPQSINNSKEKVTNDDLLKRLSSSIQGVRLVGDLKNKFKSKKKTFLDSKFIKKNTIKLKGNESLLYQFLNTMVKKIQMRLLLSPMINTSLLKTKTL